MLWLLLVAALAIVAFALFLRHASAHSAAMAPLVAACLDDFLAAHADVFAATRRPVARITLSPLEVDAATTSKVGGQPWWPAHAPLPVDAKQRPLAFLAQVDLQQLPAPLPGFPGHGLLQFFVADDDTFGIDYSEDDQDPDALAARRGHRVVYWPDTAAPAQDYPVSRGAMPFERGREYAMSFTVGEEAMGPEDHRFDRLLPGGTIAALKSHAQATGHEFEDLRDLLWERAATHGHKLGGYATFTQEDPRVRDDLELLFQLDSDDGLMWGDAGVGNFFVTDADRDARDFRRVLYTWDCA